MVFPVETSHTESTDSAVKEIERICNSKDCEYIIDHLITDHGKFNEFCTVRTLLEEEFGLKDRRIQFRVMHFLSDLQPGSQTGSVERTLRVFDDCRKCFTLPTDFGVSLIPRIPELLKNRYRWSREDHYL